MQALAAGAEAFTSTQLRYVGVAEERAARLVTAYYRVAPREWIRMPYQVRTLRSLDSSEVTDAALAQTICYTFKREAGELILEQGDLYRICLQDHRILDAARKRDGSRQQLLELLTYVLTHELVHVVRFGQHLQKMDLHPRLRLAEERKVERTTRAILAWSGDKGFSSRARSFPE